MKSIASLFLVSLLACGPLAAQAQAAADTTSKPVLASTYVAPPKPVEPPAPATPDTARKSTPPAPRPGFVPLDANDDPQAGEPSVKYIVIDGENTHIEELRVRGVSQKLTVQTRLGPKEGYEIIMGDGSRDLSPGANTSRGATGQRVWHVLSF